MAGKGKAAKSTRKVGTRIVNGERKVVAIRTGNKGVVGKVLKAFGK